MGRIPSYRLHRGSGQAVVTLDGKDHYLGVHGTAASRAAYESLISRWLAGGRSLETARKAGPTVNDVATRFYRWAEGYYRKDGEPTSMLRAIRPALATVRDLCGTTPAGEFGPIRFKAVRASWIDAGLARSTVNDYAAIVRRAFAWAVSEELIPGSVSHALREVKGLATGRTAAREPAPVGPAPPEAVDAVLGRLTPLRAAMVRLQLATGMRPGEVCRLRPCDVDRSGDVWAYTPGTHKTEHHGKSRVIAIGPKGRAVLGPVLDAAGRTTDYVFRARGKTRPVDPDVYREAVVEACVRAGVPTWTPNQLRHSFACNIRSVASLDVVQVLLGHSHASTTEIYAAADREKAAEIASRWG